MPAILKKNNLPFFMVFLLFGIAVNGCHYGKPYLQRSKPFPASKEKIAVVGFRAALNEGQTSGMVRSPISGAVFMAGPVSDSILSNMNDILFNRLVKTERYDLISPNQVKGAFSRIISDEKYNLDDIKIIKEIGKAFTADMVLVGYLYRWQEREGTNYSVKTPASVAFDLYLIKPGTGDIFWKGSFDKTQQSLTENLLDFSFFFKGKGKWMTARQLAEYGISELIDSTNPVESQ